MASPRGGRLALLFLAPRSLRALCLRQLCQSRPGLDKLGSGSIHPKQQIKRQVIQSQGNSILQVKIIVITIRQGICKRILRRARRLLTRCKAAAHDMCTPTSGHFAVERLCERALAALLSVPPTTQTLKQSTTPGEGNSKNPKACKDASR